MDIKLEVRKGFKTENSHKIDFSEVNILETFFGGRGWRLVEW